MIFCWNRPLVWKRITKRKTSLKLGFVLFAKRPIRTGKNGQIHFLKMLKANLLQNGPTQKYWKTGHFYFWFRRPCLGDDVELIGNHWFIIENGLFQGCVYQWRIPSFRQKPGTLGNFEILQTLSGTFEIFWKLSGSFEIIINSSGYFWNYGKGWGIFDNYL